MGALERQGGPCLYHTRALQAPGLLLWPGPLTVLLEAVHGLDSRRGEDNGGVGPGIPFNLDAAFTSVLKFQADGVRLSALRSGLPGLGEATVDAALTKDEAPGEHGARAQLPEVVQQGERTELIDWDGLGTLDG